MLPNLQDRHLDPASQFVQGMPGDHQVLHQPFHAHDIVRWLIHGRFPSTVSDMNHILVFNMHQ